MFNDTNDFSAFAHMVCATGAVVDISALGNGLPWTPMNGGVYRYLTSISRAGGVMGTVDSDTGPGTTTSWRIVNLDDRDYFEMLVGW